MGFVGMNKRPSVKNIFIVPNDAHYYKIIEMLKIFKIIISDCRHPDVLIVI